eukprot:365554-Chlamydomonas_euryale.AAC.20
MPTEHQVQQKDNSRHLLRGVRCWSQSRNDVRDFGAISGPNSFTWSDEVQVCGARKRQAEAVDTSDLCGNSFMIWYVVGFVAHRDERLPLCAASSSRNVECSGHD